MTGDARLLGLRLQGFKSFAERTMVEFGGGISAVVGPNGSGKSNLADALRWALGEQGRSLRTRKSEDVIFAGSEKRAALGMADVTLVLDNSDALLPVDYSVLELGRRLYRSGESDYLLNRQRVRLKDLIDLLDGAHLADNAFLFIGQGMVDQALALRPEERRPLFEEVAGVRRHDRRRRKAEDQLTEAEANLARVEDILAELRPQARRLAAQAEQQATRRSSGQELAAGLLLAARVRWHEAAGRVSEAARRLASGRGDADAALTELQEVESAAGAMAGELAARAALEQERRAAHEIIRSELTGLQLREARLSGDLEALQRDRRRLESEREAAAANVAAKRRELATAAPQRNADLEDGLSAAERALAEALAELSALRAAREAQGEQHAALVRAQAARSAEAEATRRRAADADRRALEQRAAASESRERSEARATELAEADTRLEEARNAEAEAAADRERALRALTVAEAETRQAEERLARIQAQAAASGGALQTLRTRLAEEEARGIARAARKRGGRRLDDGLEVDASLRTAVEAILGETARGYLVKRDAVADLALERGVLALPPVEADKPVGRGGAIGSESSFLERVVRFGGGRLADAVRRDPTGAVGRLLETVVWVPDLSTALELQRWLPRGWLAVTREGSAIVAPITVTLGRPDGSLERRAEEARLSADVGRLEADARDQLGTTEGARGALQAAQAGLARAREREATAATERSRGEAAHRTVARDAEAAARELAWQDAQTDRLDAEARRLSAELTGLDLSAGASPSGPAEGLSTSSSTDEGAVEPDALDAWESRARDIRARRDRLASQLDEHDRVRRDADSRHAQALASVAFEEERIGEAERGLSESLERAGTMRGEHEQIEREVAALNAREVQARADLGAIVSADAADRGRLATAEQASAVARERLRAAEERLRRAEVADLEARLGLDAIREQMLVELAGLGELGLRSLQLEAEGRSEGTPLSIDEATSGQVAESTGETETDTEADDAAALEGALAVVAPRWAAEPPPAEPPSPSRLAVLRRRYHELGAANPFAVDEYQELKARLDGLEAQGEDLSNAIARTRSLIDDLSSLIADRFQSTFRALEAAFDARFRQMFGGGFARLALTDPEDLSATGVEIVARPPGKKTQALAMLSGGERALTAVALLFAMLEVRPVPFCVLDEVDAALDEANIGRFTEALRSLASATQFIVITHNRGTIEAADALYGVTVGDDSVSRVISLRLDEATALAQEGRETAATNGHAPAPLARA